ncbi:MAG: glycosyltransferase family 2 protein [Phycisphaerae bacterium]|nr:glycosyltransferase family 2 protein [Phycisphaerae bacterium]
MNVSIITVVFNAAGTIEDCIKSIHSQTYPDIEHIIIDGGSTDETIDIINHYRDKISKIVSEKDNGVYDAMNKGIKLATGSVIGFLNADDIYAADNIISEVTAFMYEGCFDAVYGDLAYIDRRNTDNIVRYWQPGEYKKGSFFHGWVPPHPTFFCRREIFEKFGSFNDKFQIAADFELMFRFIERYKIKVGYLQKCLVKMRTGGKANVFKGIFKGNMEIIKSFALNGMCISPLFFINKPIDKICQLFRKQQVVKQ